MNRNALEYHSSSPKGKIEVITTKPVSTQRDLSLAYSPGVAEPCLEIYKNPEMVYEYTAKGNLVAVISNGTAVLGLGNLGAAASKPVMEGKGVLFKKFADIDVFDIELDSTNIDDLVKAIKMMEPTFGGINLEDFSGPDCFELEERLKKEMNIPVFHDDQHGTAIISGAAMLNAIELAGKNISEVKAVYNGAGASGIACAKFHISLGLKPENVIMCDSKGVIHKGRTDLNKFKEPFAVETERRSLEDAFKDADMFFGLSKGNLVNKDMVKSMADNPIIFALANPDPEITYPDAFDARKDIIMATGRSDYPNQVNNVLGFPFIFRGAIDVYATAINEEMKKAAAYAIAALAKEDVPDSVKAAYDINELKYGKDYIIPKPFDPRVLTSVAPAVAEAAMKTGVARNPLKDIEKYKFDLNIRMGRAYSFMSTIYSKAKSKPSRLVFPEGANRKIISAAVIAKEQGIAAPVLLGEKDIIEGIAKEYKFDIDGIDIIDPGNFAFTKYFAREYYNLRQRRGVTKQEAMERMLHSHDYFGCMMIRLGFADSMVSGLTTNYPETVRPALEIIGKQDRFEKVSGIYIVISKNNVYFLSDTTVTVNPSKDDLSDIAVQAAEFAEYFDIKPKIALLSYSNFGSADGEIPRKMREATKLIKERLPNITVDGEIQADTALSGEMLQEDYQFSDLKEPANVLIFPNLESGNISYKLLQKLGDAKVIGPVLSGVNKSVHVLQKGSSVTEIVDMTAIATVMSHNMEDERLVCSVKF
ncbi:NADP-dependent malic enzyme [Candidatus Kapabacteria bacterium]|nr:NADP-dependent malic enzyme [Candidatus Kapabacteria bacterium]